MGITYHAPGSINLLREAPATEQDDPWFAQFNQPQPPPIQTPQGTFSSAGSFQPTSQTPTQTAPSGQPWDEAFFTSTFGQPKTPDELIALESKITAAGGKVLRNAAGVAGKIQTPDGRIVDVINAAGVGGRGFQWLDGPGGGAGSPGAGTLAGLGYGFGASVAPWNEQFSAPNAQQALETPGVQFALGEANRMMQNSGAAKGTLLNGRFQQALAASNIGNALQSYGDIYNRGMGEYMLKRDNFFQNQDRPFDKYKSLADLGRPV